MKTDTSAKERLFETAGRLFYENGYRATGVDTIAAESGIGKMTLYRHYPSKDDLIVSYLRDSDAAFWANFEQIAGKVADPRQKLLAFFGALQHYVLSPACYGCPFLNLATEYPEADYAGHLVAIEHKRTVRARLKKLAKEAGARRPHALANALVLLMDGAYMASRMFGGAHDSPAAHLTEAAERLVDVYCET